jgi:hypothetical protein
MPIFMDNLDRYRTYLIVRKGKTRREKETIIRGREKGTIMGERKLWLFGTVQKLTLDTKAFQ